MREQVERLLVQIARVAVQVPSIQVVVGYMLSNLDRVRFVHQLQGDAPLAMAISAHRRIELPLAPWQGFIRGVPLPDPLMWIQAAASLQTEPITVRLSSDEPGLLQLLGPLVAPEQERASRAGWETRMESVRHELDRALDLYNEVRHLMEVDHDRIAELEKFLGIAEKEMQGMGRELKMLRSRLEESTEK
ncbi:MAG: hypothetical protein M0Z53_16405 [Thermaerobacter sp.]|nr:hypothetical protein [Thermaerobacter sp.]